MSSPDKIPCRSRGAAKSKSKCPIGTKVVLNPRDATHSALLQRLQKEGVCVNDGSEVVGVVTAIRRGQGSYRDVAFSCDNKPAKVVEKVRARELLGEEAMAAAESAKAKKPRGVNRKTKYAACDLVEELERKAHTGDHTDGCRILIKGIEEKFPLVRQWLKEERHPSNDQDQSKLINTVTSVLIKKGQFSLDAMYVKEFLSCNHPRGEEDW